ncbi:serine/threonine protein kinase [Leifsonia sp. AK011]|uniref:serine/threonine-protein kinase n=1 Tax=Leifsonia sp. AK011 TaxID=2723075 RepID=UPI0015C7DBBF|nr:serine/threonine-protein kinase [Leifsonia sp. AK011]NYF11332.1 serine/threonine protein kinase [Leifsonia sp. AK011]
MRRSASTPPDLPGYSFVKLLGSGGFSDVFLYDQALPKRRVAVKVLLTEELTAANRAAFVAEANLMAQLSAHPYIVTIYQADVASDDRPYFVMEYCSGPSLAERYKREAFGVADALRTGVRLSSAVATAHGAGILHRDIKPANVLSNDYGWPALTDFGISSAVDDDALASHTTTLADALADTASSGTSPSIGMSVPWSPPEMFEDDPSPDVRSDVFSLAATIYTILAGQSPFEVRGRSNGTLDLIGRIERGAITPMSRDDVPRSLLAVLQKGMSSDPADRFATAVDFARALQRVEMELGYTPTSIEVPNLLVDAPEKSGGPDDADETRARGVATINAQPAVPTPPPPPSTDDATLLREAPSIVAQPQHTPPVDPAASEPIGETVVRPRIIGSPAPDEQATEPQPSGRSKVVGWVIAAVAAVIAVAVIVSIVVMGGPTAPVSETAGASQAPVVIESVPTPTLVGATADGATLTFTVDNPDPVDGDVVVWRVSNRTEGEPLHRAEGTSFQVTDYAEGSTLCVEVSILRAGKTSANPLEECYPA